jgi:hypothetical protein
LTPAGRGTAWVDVIRGAGVEKLAGRVAVTVRASLSERDGELDDLAQRVVTTLVGRGLIESARLTRIVSERSPNIKRGTIGVDMRQASDPETGARILARRRARFETWLDCRGART